MKKPKIAKLPAKFIDGKLRDRKPRTIDEVLGVARYSQYATLDENVYKDQIENMLKIDLQAECLRVGLIPHDRTELMHKRLMGAFRQYLSCIDANNAPQPKDPGNPSREARDILSKMVLGNT